MSAYRYISSVLVVLVIATAGVVVTADPGSVAAADRSERTHLVGTQGTAVDVEREWAVDGGRETTADGGRETAVEVTISRQNGTVVEYRFRVDVGEDVDEFRVRLYAGRVSATDGFDVVDGARVLEWDGTANPTFTVEYDVGWAARDGCRCVATDRWVVASPVRAQFVATTDEGRSTGYLTDWLGNRTVEKDVTVEGGLFAPGLVFIGPHTTVESALGDGRRVRVVAPDVADGGVDPSRVVSAVRFGREALDVGPPERDDLTFVVVPRGEADGTAPATSLNARGVSTGRGYVFVDSATGPETWLHEYVHTRQTFTTGRSMEWFPEATAEYYGRILGERFGTGEAVHPGAAFEGRSSGGGVLSEPDTWESTFLPYDAGGRLVAYLDWRIRAATDGVHDFADVFRRLNGRESVTLGDLRRATAAVVGGDVLADEIDRYATTGERPPATFGTAEPSSSGYRPVAEPSGAPRHRTGEGPRTPGEPGFDVSPGPGTISDPDGPGSFRGSTTSLAAIAVAVLTLGRRRFR